MILDQLPAGHAFLVVDAEGFETSKVPVMIPAGDRGKAVARMKRAK